MAESTTCPTAAQVDPATATATADQVSPPDLGGSPPADANALALRAAFTDELRHALTTGYDVLYAGRAERYPYLTDDRIGARAHTTAALALAIAAQLGGFDEARAGLSAGFARAHAEQLVRAMACDHVANTPGGWGLTWQSPLWVRQVAVAGWLLWPRLTLDTKYRVVQMLVAEADRLVTLPVRYYAKPDGTVLTPGDSGAEEDAWETTLVVAAAAMMPAHPRRAQWMETAVRRMLAGFATRADTSRTTVVNGASLATWLDGWNIFADGTLVNHNRIHPLYAGTIAFNLEAASTFGLARQPTPRAALHNLELVWGGLTTKRFASPPYLAPGGVSLRSDGTVYYPQGNDWGTLHLASYVNLEGAITGLPTAAGLPAARSLEAAHLGGQMAAQARSDDGRTYQEPKESKISDREHWVLSYLSRAWMMRWTLANRPPSFSDADLFVGAVAGGVASAPRDVLDLPVGDVPLSRAGDPSESMPRAGERGPTDASRQQAGPAALVDGAADAVALDEDGVPSPAADLVEASVVAADDGSLALSATTEQVDATPARFTFGVDVDGVAGAEYDAVVTRAAGAVAGRVVRVHDGRVMCSLGGASAGATMSATMSGTVPARCLGTPPGLSVVVGSVRTGSATGDRSTTADAVGPLVVTPPVTAAYRPFPVPAKLGNEIFWLSGTEGPLSRWLLQSGRWVRDPVGLGGNVRGVSAVRTTSGTRVVVARGTNDKVYARSAGATKPYSAWRSWGGLVSSAPAVVQAADGAVEVYVRSTAGSLYRLRRTASGARWRALRSGMVGSPAALRVSGGVLVVYVGTDRLLHASLCTPARCGTWVTLTSRPTNDSPALVTHAGRTYVGFRGTDGRGWTSRITLPSGAPRFGVLAPVPDRLSGPLMLTSGSRLTVLTVDASDRVQSASGWHTGSWSDYSVLLQP